MARVPSLSEGGLTPAWALWTEFAYRKIMKRRASLGFDVRCLDHLGPLLGLAGDELAEVARRSWKHCAAQVGKSCPYLGIGETRIDFLVELVDDFRRRVLRRADPEPDARLEARQEIAQVRHVRKRL